MGRGGVAAIALLVMLVVPLAFRPARAAEPWDYLRAWQNLQDGLARGDGKARLAAVRMNAYLDRYFFSLPVETWKKRANAEALFIYALSGGNPRTIDRLLKERDTGKAEAREKAQVEARAEGGNEAEAGKGAEDEARIGLPEGALAGAAAYARGRNGLAWRLLREVKEESLGLNARAQLLLVKASLHASVKPREALSALARVRLLKPGTLAEETALRRGLLLAGREEDEKALLRLASAYLRRFRHSFYMADFLRVLARFSVLLELEKPPFIIQRLERELGLLKRREQALFHAAVARGALVEGKRRLARLAAQRALALYPDVRDFSIRMRLWLAAAEVARPRPEGILKELQELDASRLPEEDRRILQAALVVGREIVREPVLPEMVADAGSGGSGRGEKGKGGASSAGDDLPVLVRARAAVAGVEKLLGEGP